MRKAVAFLYKIPLCRLSSGEEEERESPEEGIFTLTKKKAVKKEEVRRIRGRKEECLI